MHKQSYVNKCIDALLSVLQSKHSIKDNFSSLLLVHRSLNSDYLIYAYHKFFLILKKEALFVIHIPQRIQNEIHKRLCHVNEMSQRLIDK